MRHFVHLGVSQRSEVKKDSLDGSFYAKTTAIVAQKIMDEMPK